MRKRVDITATSPMQRTPKAHHPFQTNDSRGNVAIRNAQTETSAPLPIGTSGYLLLTSLCHNAGYSAEQPAV